MSDLLFGLLSGAAWGVVAQVCFFVGAGTTLPAKSLLPAIALGAAAGPVVVYRLRSVSISGPRRLAIVSLATLVSSTAVLGFFASATSSILALGAGVFKPWLLMGLVIGPLYWVWGLASTGLLVILWPLSALNVWALTRTSSSRTTTSRAAQRGN